VVGGVGRVLIAVGVLMFAFVGYQLWGTGIQTARAQARLEDEFEDRLRQATTLPPPSTPASTVPATVATTVTPSTAAGVPASSAAPEPTAAPAEVPAPDVPAPVLAPPPPGDPMARLEIPAIGLDKIVIEGVSPSDLQDGPGHFPETPLPGQLGNAAIAGHRTTHGQPFFDIDDVEPGDEIVLTTLAGRYVYRVTGSIVVGPADYDRVIPTLDPAKATLALTSCHPKFSTSQRIVVNAELDAAASSPLTVAPVADPAHDAEAPRELPGETAAAPSAPGATTSVPTSSSSPASASPGATEPVASTAPASASDPGEAGGEPPASSQELFENGWFSDPDAPPQVALWGVALTAVSLGAWALSRRVRRNWVGGLVGIVPFVVVLYFFFENVNRLLPPNL